MPAWEEYKAEARERGSLAHEVFVVVSTPTAGPEAVKANLADHLGYIGSLETNGSLMFAGPLSDESGTQMQGIGMLILRAQTFDDAKTLAENDPMHVSGARSFTLRKWLINEGSLTVSINLAGQRVGLT